MICSRHAIHKKKDPVIQRLMVNLSKTSSLPHCYITIDCYTGSFAPLLYHLTPNWGFDEVPLVTL